MTDPAIDAMDTSPISSPAPPEDKLSGADQMVKVLVNLGKKLGFDVFTEVEASEAAWVDVVWCDRRFASAMPGRKPKLRRVPVLPVAAFEVENKTGLNPKHVKGSVSNLNNCGAQMGVIVLGNESMALLRKQAAANASKDEATLEAELIARAYRWIHAEAQPKGRIVLMSERELNEWATREGVGPSSNVDG